MPKYMITSSTWCRQAPGEPLRVLQAGDVIEFDGIPGTSMAPMDAEAAKRVRRDRPHAAKLAKRFRRSLSRQDAARLDAAQAAFNGGLA